MGRYIIPAVGKASGARLDRNRPPRGLDRLLRESSARRMLLPRSPAPEGVSLFQVRPLRARGNYGGTQGDRSPWARSETTGRVAKVAPAIERLPGVAAPPMGKRLKTHLARLGAPTTRARS